MCDRIQELRDEVVEILRTDYPSAKRAVFRLEVFRRTKSRKAVYELRDFLDHLALLFADDVSVETAEIHIYECRTHLRRCVVEPLEYMAERQFVRVDRYARWFARVPCWIRKNPVAKKEFFQEMVRAQELIVEGPATKATGKACDLFDEAFGILTDLLSQVHPLRYLVDGLFWLSLIVGAALCSTPVTEWVKGLLASPAKP